MTPQFQRHKVVEERQAGGGEDLLKGKERKEKVGGEGAVKETRTLVMNDFQILNFKLIQGLQGGKI